MQCKGLRDWEGPAQLGFVKDFWIFRIRFSCKYTLGRGPTVALIRPYLTQAITW